MQNPMEKNDQPVISLSAVSKVYTIGSTKLKALDEVSLDIYPGEFACTSDANRTRLPRRPSGSRGKSRSNRSIRAPPSGKPRNQSFSGFTAAPR